MEIFTTIVICFLSVYGTFQLLYNISLKLGKSKIQSEKLHTILVIDDTVDAECYIRSVMLNRAEERLFVLNLCQNQDTFRILQVLEAEYPMLKITNKDEYIDYISNI